MIVQKEFIGKLRGFGLNTYESRLWTALLSRGVSTAGELSDISNVPRSRTYDVLESLEKKGFIIMKIGKPIKYIAIPPEEVLERVKKQIIMESQRHTKALDKLKTSKVIEDLKMIHKQGIHKIDPADLSGALKGRNHIYDHIEMLIKNSTSTIDILTSEQGFLRKAEELRKHLKKAGLRGVKIRVITKVTDPVIQAAKQFTNMEIKHNNDIDARMINIDNKHVMVFLTDDINTHPTYDTGVWLHTEFFTQSMLSLYNLLWENSK